MNLWTDSNLHRWTLVSCVLTALTAVLGCATSRSSDSVTGRLVGPGVDSPTDSMIYTQAAGAGVQITSSAGGGRNPVALSGPEVDRLIDRVEGKLRRWPKYVVSGPFEETIMIGLAGTRGPQPFTVKLAKSPPLKEPVFLVTLAYPSGVATVALDRANAMRWISQLRHAVNS